MKIGHWQLATKPGDFKANLARVLECLDEADRRGLSIISFPESFLTGYYDTDEAFRKPGNHLVVDGPEITELLRRTAAVHATFMVGFNQMRDGDIYQSVLVAEQGRLLGIYNKAFPCSKWETPGRDFPVFERDGVRFGVVICADGGYIEPTRILALKGARLIFAPHYNYIGPQHLINHFMKVRADHAARAVENDVWFFRGNNVVHGLDKALDYEGVGYGDSYLIDPNGEIVVRSARHTECLVEIDIDFSACASNPNLRSIRSAHALGAQVMELIDQAANIT